MTKRLTLLATVFATVISAGAVAHAGTPEPGTAASTPDTSTPASEPTTTAPDSTAVPTTGPPAATTTSTTTPTSTTLATGHDLRLDDEPDDGEASTTSSTSTSTSTTSAPILPAPLRLTVRNDRLEYILATIRHLESRSTYDAMPNKGGASGAYQYIASTWANYAGFPEAYLAPPWVQDERAAADVEAILRRSKNDVSMVPVFWYLPAAATNPALLDVVPLPSAGNTLTVREYQARWLDTLAFISRSPLPLRVYPLPGLELLSGIPPVVPPTAEPDASPQLAFPVLGPVAVEPPAPCDGDECAEPRPAVIYGRKLQPVVAAASGVVTAVEPGNPATGEVSLSITDERGFTYRYSGFNDDTPDTDDGAAPFALRLTALAAFGTTVRAGQVIGFLGDTDPEPVDPDAPPDAAVWPHLRLSITDVTGQPVDAQAPVVLALFRQQCTVGIGPWSVTAHADLLDDPMDRVRVSADTGGEWTDPVIAGEWVIGRHGEVTAVGAAALVYPTTGCLWAPPVPFGPGAGGNGEVPAAFYDPIELRTDVWISATIDVGFRPAVPLRRG
jgi:hypothetical protein